MATAAGTASGVRLRGDHGSVLLGDCCAAEDNCVVHARPGETCTIGSWVTLGHGCVVHNVALLGHYAVDDDYRAAWRGFKQIYVDLCEGWYPTGLGV